LHPVGDPGLWFDNDYARGVSDVYATPNTVCGIADGTVVEAEDGPDLTSRVIARNLPSGEIAWVMAGSTCRPGSTMDGTVIVSARAAGSSGDDLTVVSVTTGKATQSIELESGGYGAKQISQVDGLRVLELGDEVLVGVDATGIVWKTTSLERAEITPLGDGHIGVSNGLDGWISIIDSRTGEPTLPRTNLDANEVEWASDGYVLGVNESDPEYAFFDLQGDEVDRTVGESQFGFVPHPSRGLTFPLDDHINAGTVTAVDATGMPAVLSSDDGYGVFLRGGKLDKSQIDLLWPRAVSADGSLVLAYGEGDDFAIYDKNGKAVITWPLATGLWVEDGYIVYTTDNSTQVLIPGV
jgi:hypothetical protein